MSKEIPVSGESLEDAKRNFQNFVSEQEITPQNLVQGWVLYEQAQNSGLMVLPKHANRGSPHIREVVRGLTEGKSIDTTTASLGHFAFKLATYEPFDKEGPGLVLEGLTDKRLEKAMAFCTAMDNIGW